MEKWKSFFNEVFRSDEHQESLVRKLVWLSMWFYSAEDIAKEFDKNINASIGLLEQAMAFSAEMEQTGMLEENQAEEVGQLAYEFAQSLAWYLDEIGVLQGPQLFKFSGFTGMDIIVKVHDPDVIDDADERACLSG